MTNTYLQQKIAYNRTNYVPHLENFCLCDKKMFLYNVMIKLPVILYSALGEHEACNPQLSVANSAGLNELKSSAKAALSQHNANGEI